MKKIERIIVYLSVILLIVIEGYQLATRQIIVEGNAESKINLGKQADVEGMQSMEAEKGEAECKEEFLEKHVYGEWRFSRRLGTMDDGRGEYPNHPLQVDFTEQGAEEMKNIRIYFRKNSVKIVDGLSPATFTNSGDMKLFGREGFHEVRYPEYHVSTENKFFFRIYQGLDADSYFCEESDVVFVRYGLRHDIDGPRLENKMAGEQVYVNPAETDKIYMNFTGLWELERVEEETLPEKRIKMLDRKDRGCMSQSESEDEKFLEKYVYGEWNISKRLSGLASDGKAYGWKGNISEQGVEEMKEGTTIWYRQERVSSWQADFTKPEDVYLFYAYGGNNDAYLPVYHVWGETDEIRLRNIYGKDEYVEMEEGKKLIEVTYDLGYDIARESAVMAYCFASHLYADPEDTDTLYLDFCGLWELKRAINRAGINMGRWNM